MMGLVMYERMQRELRREKRVRRRAMTQRRFEKLLPRAKRMGLRRAQRGDFGLLTMLEEHACRYAVKNGNLQPQDVGGDAHYDIVGFLYSGTGNIYGICWELKGEPCELCDGYGETECCECGHFSDCDECGGRGYLDPIADAPQELETDLGGFPVTGLH